MAAKRKRPIESLVLQPVNARRQRRVRVYLSLFAVLSVLAAFAGGFIYANQWRQDAMLERGQLHDQVRELERDLKSAREELAMQRTGAEVADHAQEQVRGEIRELRGQLAELEEAVAFYKSVMSSGKGDQGLKIERLDIAPTADAEVFTYRLVLTQVGDNRQYLSGNVTVTLAGHSGDVPQELNGSEVLAEGSETSFKFRYFQELTGRMKLPSGMVPEQIRVEASSTGRLKQDSQRNFIWQVQERSNAWAG